MDEPRVKHALPFFFRVTRYAAASNVLGWRGRLARMDVEHPSIFMDRFNPFGNMG